MHAGLENLTSVRYVQPYTRAHPAVHRYLHINERTPGLVETLPNGISSEAFDIVRFLLLESEENGNAI